MIKLKLALFLTAFGITACGGPAISPIEVNQATGVPVKPVDAKGEVQRYLKSVLKDPDSLKLLEVSEPKLGKYYGAGYQRLPSWYVCYTYNAKNSYGGYVGAKKEVTFFNANSVIDWPNNPLSLPASYKYAEYDC
jgi:hypothetical protein